MVDLEIKKRKAETSNDTLSDTKETVPAQSAETTNKKKKKKTKINSNGTTPAPLQSVVEKISDYNSLSLEEIRSRIIDIASRVPKIPPDGIDPDDPVAVKEWATKMQAIIEEFNLHLCCVSAATYKWGSDRSGAADQNLTNLSNELGNAQEQISSSVTQRLTNVLAPVVDLVVKESVKTKNSETGEEVTVNTFAREEVDPAFLRLCAGILCRNAVMLRQVVLANFNKIASCVDDYLKATQKDGQNDRGAFTY